ncbi:zinc finger protein [Trichonephila inaurata madagascariensis]|uniref:Zinc finger protein n=1 Tax=Trichonephila inaurata madagascariensis TaxID=2747483 RepID=A0A8X6XG84_9ARAC|nr:zinc finger protein [Trichonephila inaurata madagascariensis]
MASEERMHRDSSLHQQRADGRKRISEEAMEDVSMEKLKVLCLSVKSASLPSFHFWDWKQLIAIAKMHAPSFQSKVSDRFLKVTVADDVQYHALNPWLIEAGVEFESFLLKEVRPLKIVIRGLHSYTELEVIKSAIEEERCEILKISELKHFETKAPMPLYYLQI